MARRFTWNGLEEQLVKLVNAQSRLLEFQQGWRQAKARAERLEALVITFARMQIPPADSTIEHKWQDMLYRVRDTALDCMVVLYPPAPVFCRCSSPTESQDAEGMLDDRVCGTCGRIFAAPPAPKELPGAPILPKLKYLGQGPDNVAQFKSERLNEYLSGRRNTIEASIAAEVLAGNSVKEGREREALAEIAALENFWSTIGLRSAPATAAPVAGRDYIPQDAPPTPDD